MGTSPTVLNRLEPPDGRPRLHGESADCTAQALIADFLKRHKQMVSAFGLAQRTASGVEAGGPDAAPDASAPPMSARLGAIRSMRCISHTIASGLCAALLPEPMDDEASFRFVYEPPAKVGPRAAGSWS